MRVLKTLIVLLTIFILSNLSAFAEENGVPVLWMPYMEDVQQKIKANWNPPTIDVSNSTILLFKVGKNGELLQTNVKRSSGNEEVDKSAIEALEKAIPFKKFPDGVKLQNIDIEFSFDYNVVDNGPVQSKDISTPLIKVIMTEKPNVSFEKYLEKLCKKISEKLDDTKGNQQNSTSVSLEISQKGSLKSASLKRTSGDKNSDIEITKSVFLAAPFEPLPLDYNKKTLQLDLEILLPQ